MKKWFQRIWFKRVIYPYMLRNQAMCSVALRNAIVYQCWAGGMSFMQVNKWLRATNQDTIKAYAMEQGKPRIFYDVPDRKRRESITGQVVLVSQN